MNVITTVAVKHLNSSKVYKVKDQNVRLCKTESPYVSATPVPCIHAPRLDVLSTAA